MKPTLKRAFARAGISVSRIPRVPLAFTDQQACFAGKPARCIFDVGASIGRVALEYRRLFPAAAVYAFEPLGEHYEKLVENTRGDVRIHPMRLAVSDINGPIEFNVNDMPDTSSVLPSRANAAPEYATTGRQTVESVTLDRFAARNGIDSIDILKMDIQGAELRALHGAAELLHGHRVGVVYCEVLFRKLYERQPLFHDVSAFLQAHGYRLINLYNPVHHGREMQWADALFASPAIEGA